MDILKYAAIEFNLERADEHLQKIRDIVKREKSKMLTRDDLRLIRDVVDASCQGEKYMIARTGMMGQEGAKEMANKRFDTLYSLLCKLHEILVYANNKETEVSS